MKLNLGSGDSQFEGFTSVDLYDETADVRADICELPFDSNSVDEIVAYQVVEHISYAKSEQVLAEMYRVLKKGGFAIIETPDIDYIAKDIAKTGVITDDWLHSMVGEYYRDWDKDRYSDWENCAAAIHRNPWNIERIRRYAEPLGFKVERLPWQESQIPVPENLSIKLTK